jgi:hypothetical protein
MTNRIICLARPKLKGDEFMPKPELRLIDPKESATNYGNIPTPESDAKLLWQWLQDFLPTETLSAFKDEVNRLPKLMNLHFVSMRTPKLRWACKFQIGQRNCSIDVVNTGGGKYPLFQDLVNAMREFIDTGQVTEDELLDITIAD